MIALLFLATCSSLTQRANDNFKGVASLFGSKTPVIVRDLLATVTTFAGSICTIFFPQALLKKFSGKGLACPNRLSARVFSVVGRNRRWPHRDRRHAHGISGFHDARMTGAIIAAGWPP